MTTQQIVLQGPGPWGFRLVGGKDFEQPLAISRVRAVGTRRSGAHPGWGAACQEAIWGARAPQALRETAVREPGPELEGLGASRCALRQAIPVRFGPAASSLPRRSGAR